MALTDLEDLSETRLAQKISQLTGVGLVSVSGGQRPAVRIQLNPQALAAYGLNIDDIRTTIGNLNVNTPKGNFDGPAQASTINANDQLNSADQYRNLIVAYRNGGPVRLSDVASIVSGPENTKLGAWANTTPAIILSVQRQPGANIIQVVDRIQALLPQILASLPAAVDVTVLSDRTVTIRASVADVEFELALAVVLVVIVIFVFLRTLPGTIIPSLSVPLSLVGTFGAMYLLGFSLDNLSLMALTIATGFVVDDAIVMIENIARFVEGGMDAARSGAARLRADRLHHHFADDLADRGADTAVVHGRRRRPAVPRIRHHARGHHRHIRRRLADAGADDVRPADPPSPGGRAQQLRPPGRSAPSTAVIAPLRPRAELGAGPAAAHAAGRHADAGAHRAALRPDPEGILPGPGHRDDPGDHRGLAEHLLSRPWRTCRTSSPRRC